MLCKRLYRSGVGFCVLFVDDVFKGTFKYILFNEYIASASARIVGLLCFRFIHVSYTFGAQITGRDRLHTVNTEQTSLTSPSEQV